MSGVGLAWLAWACFGLPLLAAVFCPFEIIPGARTKKKTTATMLKLAPALLVALMLLVLTAASAVDGGPDRGLKGAFRRGGEFPDFGNRDSGGARCKQGQ